MSVSQIPLPPSYGCSAPTLCDGVWLFPFGADDCNTIVQQLPASLGCDSEQSTRRAIVESTFLFGLELQQQHEGRKAGRTRVECLSQRNYFGCFFFITCRNFKTPTGDSKTMRQPRQQLITLWLCFLIISSGKFIKARLTWLLTSSGS